MTQAVRSDPHWHPKESERENQSSLYDQKDIELAQANILFLAVKVFLSKMEHSSWLLPFFFLANTASMNYQKKRAYETVGKPHSKTHELIVRPFLNPLTIALPLPVIGPTLAKIPLTASFLRVSHYSFKKLKNTWRTPHSGALPAAALHVFNILGQAYCVKSAFEGLDGAHQKLREWLHY